MVDTYNPWSPINALSQAQQTVGAFQKMQMEQQKMQMEQQAHERDQRFDEMAKPVVQGLMKGAEIPGDIWGSLAEVDPERALNLKTELMLVGKAQELEQQDRLLEAARNTAFVGKELSKATTQDEWDRGIRQMQTLGLKFDFLLGGFDRREEFLGQATKASNWLAAQIAESEYKVQSTWGELRSDLINSGVPEEEVDQHPMMINYGEGMSRGQGVTVNYGQQTGEKLGVDLALRKVYEDHPVAIGSKDTLVSISDARKLLEMGAMTGTAAQKRTAAGKFLELIGVDIGSEAVDISQALDSVLNMMAAGQLKAMFGGQNITEGEREFLLSAMGKQNTTTGALDLMFGFFEAKARNKIADYNALITDDLKPFLKQDMRVSTPAPYKPKEAVPPGDVIKLGLQEGEFAESGDGSTWTMQNGKLVPY